MGAATLLFFYAGGAVATALLLTGYLTAEGAWGEDRPYRIRAVGVVIGGGLLWPLLITVAVGSEIRRRRGRS